MNGMPLRLRALVHSSEDRSSTKAYLLFTRQVTTGLPGDVFRFTCNRHSRQANSKQINETEGKKQDRNKNDGHEHKSGQARCRVEGVEGDKDGGGRGKEGGKGRGGGGGGGERGR